MKKESTSSADNYNEVMEIMIHVHSLTETDRLIFLSQIQCLVQLESVPE